MLLDEDIDLVKSQVSMMDIANYYGMRVNRKGYVLCPFHNDKHPSMQVFPGHIKKDGYYCRSCGYGGSIFSFVMKYENKTFEESVRMVADVFNIKISDGNNLNEDTKKKAAFQKIRLIIQSEESKIKLHQLSALSDTINLFETVMRTARPYGAIFCNIGNTLPTLKGEWDDRFRVYCDER